MKISELPQDLKEKALEYQRNETDRDYDKESDYLGDAFDWGSTKEGFSFWGNLSNSEKPTDSIVESVINQFRQRSDVGIEKYGVTLDRTDLNRLDWINHAQQEAMDLILYLEKLKQDESKNKEIKL